MSKNWVEFLKGNPGYDALVSSVMIGELIKAVNGYATPPDKLLEVGFGTGFTAIALSKLGYKVYAVDEIFELIEPAEKENEKRQGSVVFLNLNNSQLWNYFLESAISFQLIYHQGLLEHFSDEKIVEMLNQQIPLCRYLVFSVPSINYGGQDFGDEKLMCLADWQKILNDFEIVESKYYDEAKHILIVLKGGFNGK